MARHTSERERRADDAERELVQWKKVRFMADKVGDEFDGYVTGVSAFGLYIELVEHFVEGMVHVSTMADDYYRFVERAHVLQGREHRQGLSARRPRDGAGRQGRHGAAAGRSGLVEILDRGAGIGANRGPRRSKARAAGRPRARSRRSRRAPKQRKQRPRQKERADEAEAMTAVRSVVIGTAGHIDHGKSALVRALTGTDPDRLKEEQARGITIDLGFAHADDRRRRRSRSWTCPGTSASSRTCSPAPAESTW